MTRQAVGVMVLAALLLAGGCGRSTHTGNGNEGYSGDGGRATKAGLGSPYGVAVAEDGSLYVADWGNNRVRKVDPKGIITTVTGHGWTMKRIHYRHDWGLPSFGGSTVRVGRFSGDGGPATRADLYGPVAVAAGRDGSLYIADSKNCRVRKINPKGIITTVAGGGRRQEEASDGGLATMASLENPRGVALGPAGSLYFCDGSRVRKVDPKGIITTLVGNADWGFSGDGGPAARARLACPEGTAVGPDGSVYIADTSTNRVRRVDAVGIITTIAGDGWGWNSRGNVGRYAGDGGPATKASLYSPRGLAFDKQGNLYIADSRNNRIRRVDQKGIIATVAGNGIPGHSGDAGPATAASLHYPADVAVGPDGSLYIADYANQRIRKVDRKGIITTVAGNNRIRKVTWR